MFAAKRRRTEMTSFTLENSDSNSKKEMVHFSVTKKNKHRHFTKNYKKEEFYEQNY